MKPNFNPRLHPKSNHIQATRSYSTTGIYVGIVKQNQDAQLMGRLAVWIAELGGDPNDPASWFTVSYASPFAGVTPSSGLVQNSTEMSGSQQSYGFWMVPPDVDNQVLVCFVNGNTATGFWFACLYQQNMNAMVPGLPVGATPGNQKFAGSDAPVVEYNKWSQENPNSPRRPVFSPLSNGLSVQGLYPDNERGPSTSGARREAPSKLFGFLTPRGNSIHVDDDPGNEFIRLRTRSGAQVMVHQTTGYVYINSAEGNSWVEVSDKGVDIYSRGTISMRSEGSLNIKSDASLNIESDGNMNIRSGGNLTIQSAFDTDIAGNGHLVLQFGGLGSVQTSGLMLDSTGVLRLGATGDLTMASGGNNVRSASNIHDNDGVNAPAPAVIAAVVPKPTSLPDVQGNGPVMTPSSRDSIVVRMPTHEPFSGHPVVGNSGPGIVGSSEFPPPSTVSSTTGSLVSQTGSPAGPVPTSASDAEWLACCMIDEAGNQTDEGKAAVAQVIKNRIATRIESDGTIKGTILKYDQFSGFYFGTVNGRYCRVCSNPQQAEQRGLEKIAKYKTRSDWSSTVQIGQQVMAGSYSAGPVFMALRANEHGVLYLNIAVTAQLNPHGVPSWANPAKEIGMIGAHTFFVN